jgi:hypothetical protein
MLNTQSLVINVSIPTAATTTTTTTTTSTSTLSTTTITGYQLNYIYIYLLIISVCTGCPDVQLNNADPTLVTGATNGTAFVDYTSGVAGCRTGTATLICTNPAGTADALIYGILPSTGSAPVVLSIERGPVTLANLNCVNGQFQVGLFNDPTGATYPYTDLFCAI